MEIFNENKHKKWKHILKKLHKTEIADPQRLDSIKKSIETGHTPVSNDIDYLEEKYQQLKTLKNDFHTTEKQNNQKINVDNLIEIIEKLHQKEIGNFSRLESIRNYLVDGLPLIEEDNLYLKQQYEILKEQNNSVNLSNRLDSLPKKDPSEPQTILIDDVEENPTQDFKSLSTTISNIIRNSTPHFTIGIYGEWGTGKTTLMRSIENNLKQTDSSINERKILPVWFNAWKYEREENLATISLMKTVAYAMANHELYDSVSNTILKGLTIVGKDLMQQLSLKVLSIKNEDLTTELDKKMDYLNQLYRDSVYFEGLDKIKFEMDKIRQQNPEYRVVIFIDDLDRCSSNKALEVLESIKLFLDIEGFVFVIGLSHKTVTQLISQAYNATGVKGEDYIKKIIQIPIKIPSWSHESIVDLVENKITKNLHEEYTMFISQNSGMVARVVDYNPRQLKRFINNVIIAFETFAGKDNSVNIKFNEIFLVKILKKEWPEFYAELTKDKYFYDIIKWMIEQPNELKKYFKYLKTPTDEFPIEQKTKRISLLSKLSERTNNRIDSRQIDIISDFDYDTWLFLRNVKDVLLGIKNWNVINRVMDVVEEFSYVLPIGSNKSKQQIESKPVEQIKQDSTN